MATGTLAGQVDGNAPTSGSGLQVAVCPPVSCCDAQPPGGCALGSCRPLCDRYAGTPRALIAGEMTKVIRSAALNHTDLVTGDILAVARGTADDDRHDGRQRPARGDRVRQGHRRQQIEPLARHDRRQPRANADFQVSIGAALGVGLGIGVAPSCGDSSSHRPDDGVCDCPASEPDVHGREDRS
jgi:hypothetical protein